jgi:hypothetical protein
MISETTAQEVGVMIPPRPFAEVEHVAGEREGPAGSVLALLRFDHQIGYLLSDGANDPPIYLVTSPA